MTRDRLALRWRWLVTLFFCAPRCARARRRGVPAIPAIAVAATRSSSASRARHSTRRRAGSSPICRCPISPFPGGRQAPPQQPEFVQTPADYLREADFARLAAQGKQARRAAPRHARRASSSSSACPATCVLAIWGRETDYGGYKLPHDAIRVLATQAYIGRRKDMFRSEFLLALKMLQDGVPRAEMRSSWGGAMGLTQFLPSEFYKYAVDFDGDGRVDIWTFGAGCARLGGQAARRQGLAARQALGLRGARAGRRRLHHRASPSVTHADRRMAQARLSCRPTGAS